MHFLHSYPLSQAIHNGEGAQIWSQQPYVQIPADILPSSLTLGKLHNLSKPQRSSLQNGDNSSLQHRAWRMVTYNEDCLLGCKNPSSPYWQHCEVVYGMVWKDPLVIQELI